MSASDRPRAQWPEAGFWEQFDRLETHHQRLHSEHDRARRELERLSGREADEVRRVWRHYCEVIAELDRATNEFEVLRS